MIQQTNFDMLVYIETVCSEIALSIIVVGNSGIRKYSAMCREYCSLNEIT